MGALDSAVKLAQLLGDPALDLAILAEGNTSAKESETSFWVKASGYSMRDIPQYGFVEVLFEPILAAFQSDSISDADVKQILSGARSEQVDLMPSVETFMHAYLLGLPNVTIVGHTHPTALLSLLTLHEAEQFSRQRIFPDEVVCCGPASAFVPYVDPGLPLARAIKTSVEKFVEEMGAVPKTIWLQNHGLIALGISAQEVESATRMTVKAARIWLGALSTAKPIKPLTQADIERIASRPDEHYRQRLLWQVQTILE